MWGYFVRPIGWFNVLSGRPVSEDTGFLGGNEPKETPHRYFIVDHFENVIYRKEVTREDIQSGNYSLICLYWDAGTLIEEYELNPLEDEPP